MKWHYGIIEDLLSLMIDEALYNFIDKDKR